MEERRGLIFAGVGAVGLIIGIVALVIAIGAKNDAESESELSATLQHQLEDKAASLEKGIKEEAAQTGSVAKQARKGIKAGKTAQSQEAADVKSLTSEIDTLKGANSGLKSSVSDLEDSSSALKQQLNTLNRRVNQLNQEVAKVGGRDG